MELKSGLILDEGEELVCELSVTYGRKWWEFLVCAKSKGFLVVTNKRIAEISSRSVCCCCTTRRIVKYVMPRHIYSVSYEQWGSCCTGYYVCYSTPEGKTSFAAGTKENATKIVSTLYKIVDAAR